MSAIAGVKPALPFGCGYAALGAVRADIRPSHKRRVYDIEDERRGEDLLGYVSVQILKMKTLIVSSRKQ